jgi:hypothetical protein
MMALRGDMKDEQSFVPKNRGITCRRLSSTNKATK